MWGWGLEDTTARVLLSDDPSRFKSKLLHRWTGEQRRRLDSGALCSALFCPVLWQGGPEVASGAQHSAPAQAWSWQGDREIALFIVPGASGFLKPV